MTERKKSTNGLSMVTAVGNIGERLTDNVVELDCTYSYSSPKGKVEKSEVVLNLNMSQDELDVLGLETGDRVMVIGSLVADPDTEKNMAALKPHAGKIIKTSDKKLRGLADFNCNIVTTIPGTVREGEFGATVNIPAAINAYKGTVYVSLAFQAKDSVKKLEMLKNIDRGTSMTVRGKLNTSVSKQGKKYLSLDVKDFGLLGRRDTSMVDDASSRPAPKRKGPLPPRVTHATTGKVADEDYDDLPF